MVATLVRRIDRDAHHHYPDPVTLAIEAETEGGPQDLLWLERAALLVWQQVTEPWRSLIAEIRDELGLLPDVRRRHLAQHARELRRGRQFRAAIVAALPEGHTAKHTPALHRALTRSMRRSSRRGVQISQAGIRIYAVSALARRLIGLIVLIPLLIALVRWFLPLSRLAHFQLAELLPHGVYDITVAALTITGLTGLLMKRLLPARREFENVSAALLVSGLAGQLLAVLAALGFMYWRQLDSPLTVVVAASVLPAAWCALMLGGLNLAYRIMDLISVSAKVEFVIAGAGIGACVGSGYAWSRDGWRPARDYWQFLFSDGHGGWPAVTHHLEATMPLGLLLAGALVFPVILAEAVARPVINWWSQRIWMVDPQLAALSDLIYVFTMLRGEMSLARTGTKAVAIRRLRRAGQAVEHGLPRTIALGNGPARQVFADRCRVAGRSIEALCLWVALPKHDTHIALRDKLAVLAAALATGRYDELPADPQPAESVPQRFRRLVHVLRSLVVAAVPLLGVYLASRLGIRIDGVVGGTVVAFCVAWAVVTCLPLLKPAWTERLAGVRDLMGTLKSASAARSDDRGRGN